MAVIRNIHVDLEHTLESGQLFRYFQKNNWWYIQTGDKVFKLRSEKNLLHYEGNIDEQYLREFLRLHDDVDAMVKRHSTDNRLKEAFEKYRGLRITRQDPWECIVSFLCSSASNIPKIKMNVHHMSKTYGKEIVFDDMTFYTFPKLGVLNDMAVLKEAKTGFRAKYIHATNKLLTQQRIEEIQKAPYEQAKQFLMECPGIGEKVADCILLFGFGKMEAFPVDTWMHKIMTQWYIRKKKTPPHKIAAYARRKFGSDAGYVQQYLFYYSRKHLQ